MIYVVFLGNKNIISYVINVFHRKNFLCSFVDFRFLVMNLCFLMFLFYGVCNKQPHN